jgi:hypothetical protein
MKTNPCSKRKLFRIRFENERALFAQNVSPEWDPDEAFGGKDLLPEKR